MRVKNVPRGFQGFALYVLPLLAYCCALFYVSSLPQPPMPDLGFDWGDKLAHAGAFFLMALFAYRAAGWIFPEKGLGRTIVIGICFASLYGATDEVHQYFVPERSADILDWIADTIGAILSAPALLLLHRLKPIRTADILRDR